MGINYYNDNDPKACAWLRELIAAGLIPDGRVDNRSILEIKADELAGYDQCHFFAGVGFWALALRWAGLEGWPGIWTGSCPCQPFSCAGSGKGTSDERHLWPVFRDLIWACRPRVVFGEQVASAAVVGHIGPRPAKAAGTVWLDGVRADMEAAGYAFGASVLGAHSVGAPHIRQRCYWVADGTTDSCGARTRRNAGTTSGAEACGCGPWSTDGMHGGDNSGAHGVACRPPDSSLQRAGRSVSPEQGGNHADAVRPPDAERLTGESRRVADMPGERAEAAGVGAHAESGRLGAVGGTSDVQRTRLEGHTGNGADGNEPGRHGAESAGHAAESGGAGAPWSGYRVHRYLDGKDRRIPTEPRLFPLADDRHPWHRGRVGLLRGAGNAIVPALAAEFIGAWMECADGPHLM